MGPVVRALERMLAMRAYQRAKHVDGIADERVLHQVGLTVDEMEQTYRAMAIANDEDRFVISTPHREYAEDAFDRRGGCGFSFGNGCNHGEEDASPVRRRRAADDSDQGGRMTMPIAYDEGRPLQLTLRALAYLLRYPDAATRARYPEVSQLLHDECMIGEARLAEIDALIRAVSLGQGFDAEANYVELFDRGRGTALHLCEHVHGDSLGRGPAMVDLIATYEAAGLRLQPGELPDHLTVWLEYASIQPPHAAVGVLREVAHILQRIYGALALRGSGYAALIAALLELAGAQVCTRPAPAEPSLAQGRHRPCFVDPGQRVTAATP